MDPQADSDEEFIVVSTSDSPESASYPGTVLPQAGGLTNNAKLLVKSFASLLGARVTEFQASGAARTHIRKYSETMGRHISDHRSITNYNYNIQGGFGGSGGEGFNQGGDGGAGQGPTVYFGQPQERESSAFRTIRRGDVKLVGKEVVVNRLNRGGGVRRIYHAEIRGDPGTVTVAMYQGDSAEEEWQKDIAKYESIWDPRIMQLHGLVSGKELYAMVFHDELIPYAQFLRRFKHSPVLSTYIQGYCSTEFREAVNYISNVFRKFSRVISMTGQHGYDPQQDSSVSISPQDEFEMGSKPPRWDANILRLENVLLDAPGSEDAIISSLSEDQYHKLCSQSSITRHHWFQVPTEHPVGPGIFRLDSQRGTCVRITEPLQILPEEELDWRNYGDAPDEQLPNSWIRYNSHRTNTLQLELRLPFWEHRITKAWLAQANCIFAELEETAHVEDYVCIYTVEFTLRIADKRDIPEGYLFVCSPQDFRTDTEPHANLYQWPACPAYWSLGPSGADRLSTEDARNLGFPTIHIETVMEGFSWDRSVYEGLRRFHQGKGFDPDGREVARRLGYPLYEVLSDRVPFSAREGELQFDGVFYAIYH
ncbi:hypothetical protein MSAN_01503100 [Mycena sanguinolenta]|uniref:Uncharacterized protein n=1 Tax=Mycena sanguinolenta TaxID=230812 RepID=A0A8H7CZ15_9AGAR|nr:hypothetical protein MSAN_01503100 [Mycena sanguinolenta]